MTTKTQKKTALVLAGAFTLGLAGLAMAMPPGDRMKAADTDGDGAISQEEFQAKRAEKFNEFNTDGAGLTYEQFTAMMEAQKQERKESRQQRMFNHLDANGDGVIDEAEFAAKADKRFSMLDTDGDGLVSMDEIKAKHASRKGGHRGHHGGWSESPATETE